MSKKDKTTEDLYGKGTKELRDYGSSYNPVPVGVPTWKRCEAPEAKCPNCGAQLCDVEVTVKGAIMNSELADCRYLGCPCCPFASRSVTTAHRS
mgnify:CR=1 FL=1